MKNTTRILFMSWLIVSGSAGSPTPCLADTAVTLGATEIEVSRPAVRLSDLFMGIPSSIDRDIAMAPPACKPAVYDAVVLRKLAQTYRLDWQDLSTADHVTVSSPCTKLSNDTIREKVIEMIKAENTNKKVSFEIAFDRRAMEVNIPAKETSDFTLENFAYNPTTKQFRADLTAQTSHGSFVYPLTGRVAVKRYVPTFSHRLENGTVISAGDLDWLEVPEERVTADVVTEPSQLIGREVRRDSADNDIIRARDVMPPRFVQRGSVVTMKIETPFILITSQGKAQQDGVEGETIRVMNTQSNRIVEGIVTAPGVVEIKTARKIAAAE
jgi:flagella basal body P-ring formation protein FlgA